MIARRVGQVLTVVVLVTSATYLLVYLYRWEWNRALVAGVFFLGAEIAFVASAVLRRLGAIEARLAAPQAAFGAGVGGTTATGERLAVLRTTAPPRRNHFAWLEESTRSTGVFVPVLLGAGVILSGLAHLVERLAGATAAPAMEHRLAGRLAVLGSPPADLLAPVAPPAPPVTGGPRLLARGFLVAVALLGVAGTVQLIDIVADATQTRSDTVEPGRSLEITLGVETVGRGAGVHQTAEALWVACRGTANRRVDATALEPVGNGVFRFVVTPTLGQHARRRLEGCLEDATLDRARGNVVSFVEIPTPTAEPEPEPAVG